MLTYEDLTELLHEAFKERLEQGLKFTCSFMTAQEYAEKTKNGTLFVALDNTTQTLLGTVTITTYIDKDSIKYGYHEYLAVHPGAKRLGVATLLLEACVSFAKAANCKYLTSDTSCGADSSVKWHVKNGFKIYELESYRSTNYWLYVFVKPFEAIAKFSAARIKVHYLKSYIFIKLTRHIDGSDTWIGKIYKQLR